MCMNNPLSFWAQAIFRCTDRKLFQKMWGIDMPQNGKRVQEVGLQVIRELQRIVTAVYDSGKHAGIEAAKKEAGLRPLSSYDVQVQGCECIASRFPPSRLKATTRVVLEEGGTEQTKTQNWTSGHY